MEMLFYTGIGSRETPKYILLQMREIAKVQAKFGYSLRSGAAPGADSWFEDGQKSIAGASAEIYLPWRGFENRPCNETYIHLGTLPKSIVEKAEEMVEDVHPAWGRLSQGAKKLHTRNVFQVLGKDLESPSQVVICWTEGGIEKGGTRTAIKIAEEREIPVWNLGA